MLKLGHYGKQIKNTCTVLKYGAEKEWSRSFGSTMQEMSIMQSQGGEEYPTYNKKKEDQLRWTHLAQELLSNMWY